jgi:succinate dehydrogenase/fumarate reductase-like Fe-S protein
MAFLRIDTHPILEFDRGEKITFFYNGEEIEGYTRETVVDALHAAGVRKLGTSPELHRPRGLFCAIGNCSSCSMTVDGEPNVRVCVTKCRQGMRVDEQVGRGVVKI